MSTYSSQLQLYRLRRHMSSSSWHPYGKRLWLLAPYDQQVLPFPTFTGLRASQTRWRHSLSRSLYRGSLTALGALTYACRSQGNPPPHGGFDSHDGVQQIQDNAPSGILPYLVPRLPANRGGHSRLRRICPVPVFGSIIHSLIGEHYPETLQALKVPTHNSYPCHTY